MQTMLNITSVPWLVLAIALMLGVLLSGKISAEVWGRSFFGEIFFSEAAIVFSVQNNARLGCRLYAVSLFAILVAKSIAWWKRRKIMRAFK